MFTIRRICRNILRNSLLNRKQVKPAIFIGDERHYNSNNKYWVQDKFGCFIFLAASGYLTYKLYQENDLLPKVEAAELLNFEKNRDRFNFVADVVHIAAPAVVYIEIKDSRFNFFTGKPITISNGSGFIIKEDGLILTNAHVVTNKPHTTVEVRLHNGKTYQGFVEDADIQSDLATVRIRARNLPTLKLGKSSDLRAGEFVIAMGSPLALSNTVTFGVISSVHRASQELGLQGRVMSYLQTDAAITFGNSGGPLINLDGEAIGINSMKVTSGISFAIPSDYVKKFLDDTKGGKRIMDIGRRKYMGITMLTLTPEILNELRQRGEDIPREIGGGVLVWKVIIGSPAHNGGLQPGDIVTHIDDKPIKQANDVYKILNEIQTRTIKMTIFRNSKKLEVRITPEALE